MHHTSVDTIGPDIKNEPGTHEFPGSAYSGPNSELKYTTAREANAWSGRAIELSHQLHAHPEVAFEEVESAKAVSGLLEDAGFVLERGVAGLDTAFVATKGSGELVIGICAELDALPEVGHACGHNIIAAAAVTAGIALAAVADEIGVCVKVFGTPAEEAGGGKIIMLKAGVFDGVHAAMMVHPGVVEYPDHVARAVVDMRIRFTGRTAHAAAAPHEGINAGDAVTISQVAIGLLRQQLRPGNLVHGVVVKAGEAANSIPASGEMLYSVRANTLDELGSVKSQLIKCLEAGALATGASLEILDESEDFSEFRNDQPMVDAYRKNLESLGRVFDSATTAERMASAPSTDMGNISLAMPAIHPNIRIEAHGSSNHQPEFAKWCAEPDANNAILDGGLGMAWTAIDLATSPEQRARLIEDERLNPRRWPHHRANPVAPCRTL